MSTANNPWTSVDVQVLGRTSDPATTTLSLSAGSWRLLDAAEGPLATGTSARKISIARTMAGLTAKITENGTVRRTIGARPTLYLEWTGTDYWAGTASNQDAFGTAPQSHLAHVADPYSAQAPGNPNTSWTGTLTQARAKSVFGLGWVKTVKVTERYSSGQVRTMRAVAPNGTTRTLTDTAEGWRTALGFQGAWVDTVTATR